MGDREFKKTLRVKILYFHKCNFLLGISVTKKVLDRFYRNVKGCVWTHLT